MQLIGRPHLPSTRQIQRRVGDNPVQPRPERLLQVESVQRFVRANKRFLNRILRILVDRYYRTRHGVCTLRMQPNQQSKRVLVAPLGGRGQDAFVWSITRLLCSALNGGKGGWGHRREIYTPAAVIRRSAVATLSWKYARSQTVPGAARGLDRSWLPRYGWVRAGRPW